VTYTTPIDSSYIYSVCDKKVIYAERKINVGLMVGKKPKEIILKKYNRYNDLGHMLISFVSKGVSIGKRKIFEHLLWKTD